MFLRGMSEKILNGGRKLLIVDMNRHFTNAVEVTMSSTVGVGYTLGPPLNDLLPPLVIPILSIFGFVWHSAIQKSLL